MMYFVCVVFLAALVAYSGARRSIERQISVTKQQMVADNVPTETINQEVERQRNEFPWPTTRPILIVLAVISFCAGLFNSMFFYAEPGYIYHVRTITGKEIVVDGVGFSLKAFGRVNPWKKAMTVQAAGNIGATTEDQVENSTGDNHSSNNTSANLSPLNIVFLDQVDANASATARFRIPVDPETFLILAHEYRTSANFLQTAIIPAFKETLQASASLMSAEEYFSGARTEFNSEFEDQLRDGIYVVRREAVRITDQADDAPNTANAAKGTDQEEYGNKQKVIFRVEKVVDERGIPIRKLQSFKTFGIQVVEARVTEMTPNARFIARMQSKQDASADRAIAREKRVQEQEQRLLAIAEGKRKVAERSAIWLADQIEQTTKAETAKQLAITEATKLKEQAEIDKKTALLQLERAKTDAKRIRELATAEAFRREKILKADNALSQKLEAEIKIQQVWAEAFANRAVPQYVFGGTNNGVPNGSDSETANFMKLMTIQAAKSLNYKRDFAE